MKTEELTAHKNTGANGFITEHDQTSQNTAGADTGIALRFNVSVSVPLVQDRGGASLLPASALPSTLGLFSPLLPLRRDWKEPGV